MLKELVIFQNAGKIGLYMFLKVKGLKNMIKFS